MFLKLIAFFVSSSESLSTSLDGIVSVGDASQKIPTWDAASASVATTNSAYVTQWTIPTGATSS